MSEVSDTSMKLSTSGMGLHGHEVEEEKKCLNSELWHACAGPLVSLPTVGSRVVYFPQGHSEQVVATTNKEVDSHLPNYPSLPAQLICQLHSVTMHADVDTDEVYAQMTLQPLTPQEQKDACLPMELGVPNRQPTNYFCKTLTASDTSTHGGFSVPRRAAEKDFSQTPPAQELVARDIHDVEWKFRHIFRGQPKRHLLTTGWSVFVSAKRLVAGDAVIFIWNDQNQLLLGIRRAIRPQNVMPSSVLSSDSMHIGLLAAAAATNSCFTVFYNPMWASSSEFVIPFSKYFQAVYHTRVSVGMRFRMLFETEESSVRRYMGTITGIGDLDPVRWPNSHWRSVKVGWDESTAGERQPRVSLWEIEPLTTFPMYPSLFPLSLKRPCYPGPLASSSQDGGNEAINSMAWLRGEAGFQGLNSVNFQTVGMIPWMQQRFDPMGTRTDLTQQYQAMLAGGLQNLGSGEMLKNQFMQFQQPVHYLPGSGSHNSQPPQGPLSSVSPHLLPTQTQMLSGNMQRPLQQVDSRAEKHDQEHNYQEAYFFQHDQLQQRSTFDNLSSASVPHSTGPEGSANLPSFSRVGEPILTDQSSPQQSWMAKFTQSQVHGCFEMKTLSPLSGKDASDELKSSSLDTQNQAPFADNIDTSAMVMPTTASIGGTVHADISSIQTGASRFKSNLLYGSCDQDSSNVLQTTELEQPTQACTFVKVYKTGCVSRSVNITQFKSYEGLIHEVGQMFGIEGLLEDPRRSGWQLVFVDRENDVLLLGDDPWEAFVNNVWYIKILSPEDVVKMGKEEDESLSKS